MAGMGKLSKTQQKERIELVMLGDSVTKYISPERIATSNISNPVNYSKNEPKIREIHNQFRQFQLEHEHPTVKNVIVRVGTNHVAKDDQGNMKIRSFLHNELPDTSIFYSGILPKMDWHFGKVNHVNEILFNLWD